MCVALFKLAEGNEMLPAGLSQMNPQQSLPNEDDALNFQRRAFIPLTAGQLNVTDKHCGQVENVLQYFGQKMMEYNQKGIQLTNVKEVAEKVVSFN